ncbi:MAG: hypothetical protein CMF13_02240 [Idiomarina sp.]|nr:hypothetical protein [Idiomarina sp.]|tara:strand:- start:179 stop:382 length:204 start_codon:yes stop_codon:yes gene_type:complete
MSKENISFSLALLAMLSFFLASVMTGIDNSSTIAALFSASGALLSILLGIHIMLKHEESLRDKQFRL